MVEQDLVSRKGNTVVCEDEEEDGLVDIYAGTVPAKDETNT